MTPTSFCRSWLVGTPHRGDEAGKSCIEHTEVIVGKLAPTMVMGL